MLKCIQTCIQGTIELFDFNIPLNDEIVTGDMREEDVVLKWMVKQKTDESIEEIDRETLFEYIDTKDFLAVVFCKLSVM